MEKIDRSKLQKKLVGALRGEFSYLSTDFQEMLVEDLVTAIANRIKVLYKIQTKRQNA